MSETSGNEPEKKKLDEEAKPVSVDDITISEAPVEKGSETSSEEEGESPKVKSSDILRNKFVVGKPLTKTMYDDCVTLTSTLEHICKEKKEKIMYGARPLKMVHEEMDEKSGRKVFTKEFGEYKHYSFSTVWKMIEDVSLGMKEIFPTSLEKGKKIGIWLETRMEWIISAHAMFNNSLVLVTLYPDLTSRGLIHILNECEMEMIIINAEKLEFLSKEVAPKCAHLKTVIAVREKPGDPKRTVSRGHSVSNSEDGEEEKKSLEVHYYEDVLESGKQKEDREFSKPQPKDLAFLMYTSGTTGDPKGVMVTHEQLLSATRGFYDVVRGVLKEDDVYMTYLPLSHSLEFVVHHCVMFSGTSIGFGSPRSLVKKKGSAKLRGDLEVIKPSGFVVVPRILETIKKEVFKMLKRQPGWKQSLFTSLLNSRIEFIRTQGKVYTGFWSFLDSVVFKRVRELFGGRMRGLISGGAPLSPDTQVFFQACLGIDCMVFQGYGLSETCSATLVQDYFAQRDGTYKLASVGVPVTSVEVKLVDVPHMNYYVDGERTFGEICIRGNNVSKGYYKKPELTKKDGWFHSGDVGEMHADGTISVIDRIKNLAKLAQGEYVALEYLESVYGASEFVQASGLCITPNSFMTYLGAVVMVDPTPTLEYAKANGIVFETLDDLCKNESFIKAVLGSFAAIQKEKGLASYEGIKKVKLFNDIFDVSNGTTTPSNKLKRRVIGQKYEKEINEMYGR